ncbi:hypothetical protein C8R44DRAFT_786905, partial [Mycena epipterygia]
AQNSCSARSAILILSAPVSLARDAHFPPRRPRSGLVTRRDLGGHTRSGPRCHVLYCHGHCVHRASCGLYALRRTSARRHHRSRLLSQARLSPTSPTLPATPASTTRPPPHLPLSVHLRGRDERRVA